MNGFSPSILAGLIALAAGGCALEATRERPAVEVERRAVDFLRAEVPAWSKDNGCFSCHNNGDAARALYAAGRAGFRVPADALADTTAWVTQPAQWKDNKGDPGFSDQRLANIQFAASLLAAIESGHATDRGPLEEAARMVAADQDSDGGWNIEPGNAVGSPATHGTTLATFMALRVLVHAGLPETDKASQKAASWLQKLLLQNVPTAATLLMASRSGCLELSRRRQGECLDFIRRAQTGDGGWGPYPDSPPEPFDTALVLLAIADRSGETDVKLLVQDGRRFLIARQEPDGGWPATTRPPGAVSYAQRISTTAWVTLALLATRDSAAH